MFELVEITSVYPVQRLWHDKDYNVKVCIFFANRIICVFSLPFVCYICILVISRYITYAVGYNKALQSITFGNKYDKIYLFQ